MSYFFNSIGGSLFRVCIGSNGYVYETYGISKHFPVMLQGLMIRAEMLDKVLTAKCFIYDVELNPPQADSSSKITRFFSYLENY